MKGELGSRVKRDTLAKAGVSSQESAVNPRVGRRKFWFSGGEEWGSDGALVQWCATPSLLYPQQLIG